MANFSAGTVGEYNASTGAAINASLITGPYEPTGLALDGSGHLYVTQQGNGLVGEYDASTGATINANFITGLDDPTGLARDASGDFYVSNQYDGIIGKYDASGNAINTAFISVSFSGYGQGPFGLTLDNSGDLYVVNDYTSTVGKYDASTGATINANFITGMQGISMIADATATPEPATNVVFCAGIAALAGYCWLQARAERATGAAGREKGNMTQIGIPESCQELLPDFGS